MVSFSVVSICRRPASMKLFSYCVLLLLSLGLAACAKPTLETAASTTADATAAPVPVDEQATAQTAALLRNLHAVKEQGFLFGHQDSLAYGVEWWDEPGRADVKALTGDYPALYGWDIGNLELGDTANLDDVDFAKMKNWIREGYARGGVITVSWHMNHPVTQQDSWQVDQNVAELLPGAAHHEKLKQTLDKFADFVRDLKAPAAEGGQPIPIIFRPWHEHNGDWFWWGTRHTNEADYVALWRFTVDYLRNDKQLHNLLYAFSPDRSRIDMDNFRASYLYAYPGDDYVDILGIDNYWDLGHPSNDATRQVSQRRFQQSLEGVVGLAQAKGKVAAMTEGGQDTVHQENFYTETLLAGLLASDTTRQIAYAQVWRNANRAKEQRDHFYVPHPGHASADDFIEFYQHPATLFESDLPNMYE